MPEQIIIRNKIGRCAICGAPVIDYSDYPLKAMHAVVSSCRITRTEIVHV